MKAVSGLSLGLGLALVLPWSLMMVILPLKLVMKPGDETHSVNLLPKLVSKANDFWYLYDASF